jgi:mannose-6-phosphate isomerase-like protein (cupin superfamily)
MTCPVPRRKTLILKYRAWEALTAGRGLLSWLNEIALHQPSLGSRIINRIGGTEMQTLTAGITKAGTGIEGIVWNILGQTYVPKSLSESSFSWHATFPPGTFVPPHIHPTQDEFIYLFEGRLDLILDGKDVVAQPGDLIRMPMNIPHGIFNKSDQTVKCFFWVSPTRKLYDLFSAIHSMREQKPEEVVALSARHEVNFLPPPA